MQAKRAYRCVALAAAGWLATGAQAIEIEAGSGWQVRWDNTLKYSGGLRVKAQDLAATSANSDDGNRSFDKGVISNRFDLLSEFDAQKDGFGLRLSAAAWYDTVYNRGNDHGTAATVNHVTAPANRFGAGTVGVAGRRSEMLDWFVFGRHDLAGRTLSWRLGQHSLIWGTSLFFGMNGMAKGMAPTDVYKLSIPGSQAKETTIPVPQLSSTLQLTDETSLEAYVQFRYRPTRLHPAGSYLSTTDMLGSGAERMFIGDPLLGGHRCGTPRKAPVNCNVELTGIDEGDTRRNFGLALNTRSDLLDADLGFYAISYRDMSQVIETNTTAGTYRLVVPKDPVRAVGMSLSRLVGSANVGVELSLRDKQPLAVKEAVVTAADPSYVTGRTVHLNVSTVMVLPKGGFWEGASVTGEFAANHVLEHEDVRTTVASGRWGPAGVPKINADRKRTSAGLRVIFTPTWYQVVPGVDLSAPINLGWSFAGLSAIDTSFPFGGSPDRAGELILGLTGVYLNRWTANLSYINYLGSASRQPLLDRNYLRLSVQATF